MRFIIFLLILFALPVTSCEKQCIKAEIDFALIGFSDAEADTIVLRRFEKNGSFAQPKDTVLLDNIQFSRRNDSLQIAAIAGYHYLTSDYNYQLFFPGASTVLTITDILENKNTMTKGLFNCTKEACINQITGYTINGQFSNSVVNNNLIYLKK